MTRKVSRQPALPMVFAMSGVCPTSTVPKVSRLSRVSAVSTVLRLSSVWKIPTPSPPSAVPSVSTVSVYSVCLQCSEDPREATVSTVVDKVDAFLSVDSVWSLLILQAAIRVWSAATVNNIKSLQSVWDVYRISC